MGQRRLGRVGVVLVCSGVLVAGATADPIQDIINQATLTEYQSYLRVLTGVDPLPGNPPAVLINRDAYGPLNAAAGGWIRNQFASAGLATTLDPFEVVTGVWQNNVIAEIPGTTRPEDIYVISAHYDTAPTDLRSPYQPGCDDNGSGTAAVLMAARILSQYQFEGTIRFAAFSAEEQWMVGSEAYVRDAAYAGENIVANINFDMLLHPGFDNLPQNPDYDLEIEGNGPSQWLAQYMADQITTYTPLAVQVHNDPNQVSDHAAFWWYGYDAIGLTENTADEIWGGSNDTYHQVTDVLGNADFDWEFGLSAVRGGMAGLVGLAGLVPEPGSLALLLAGAALCVAVRRR